MQNRFVSLPFPVLKPNLTCPISLPTALDSPTSHPGPSIAKGTPLHQSIPTHLPTNPHAPIQTTSPNKQRVHLPPSKSTPFITQTNQLDSTTSRDHSNPSNLNPLHVPSPNRPAIDYLPRGKANLEDKVFIK